MAISAAPGTEPLDQFPGSDHRLLLLPLVQVILAACSELAERKRATAKQN